MKKIPTNWVQMLGGLFLGIALYRFLFADGWIVWLLLGFLLGGFSLLNGGKSEADEQNQDGDR